MPPPDLDGWSRVTVPPKGKLGREQWHLDIDRKVLICDGVGGHEMLLLDNLIGDAIFHLEIRYTKIEGVTCQFDQCGLLKGHIGLESEGYRVEFRNLKLKELVKP